MQFLERKLNGVFEIRLNPQFDTRGFFMRTFDSSIFKNAGSDRKWIQENHSRSEYKDIIRGLHLQIPPYSETKLVRCIKGSVLDVFVDLRYNSPTFCQWDAIELSEENKKMIYIPRGFAHGFCTLTDISEVLYKVDNEYAPDYEIGIIWNDPFLKIKWPVDDPVLSEKDKNNLTISQFKAKYKAIHI